MKLITWIVLVSKAVNRPTYNSPLKHLLSKSPMPYTHQTQGSILSPHLLDLWCIVMAGHSLFLERQCWDIWAILKCDYAWNKQDESHIKTVLVVIGISVCKGPESRFQSRDGWRWFEGILNVSEKRGGCWESDWEKYRLCFEKGVSWILSLLLLHNLGHVT